MTHPGIWMLVVIGVLLGCNPAVRAQPSSQVREDFWVPDGPVHAIVETNGVVYLGGQFSSVSRVSRTGTAFDVASGLELPEFPKVDGAIKVIQPDGLNGWYVGGQFNAVGGSAITNLVHIFADQTVNTNWVPNPDGTVLALAVGSDRIFVGGQFTTIGGQPRSLLAAVDPIQGAARPGWMADVTSLGPPSVNALLLSGNTLFVGGSFSHINENERHHIASLDQESGEVTSWFPSGYTGSQSGSAINALALAGTTLIVGGTFTSIGGRDTNGPARNRLAALDITRTNLDAVLPWNPDANGPVTSLAVSCDTVYVGGGFTSVGGAIRHRLAALDLHTGQARNDWDPDADAEVQQVLLIGNTVYAGGNFTRVGGEHREHLAALDTTTGRASPWSPRADRNVAGLAISGTTLLAGGSLGSGGTLRNNVAAFDVRTGRLLDWNPNADGVTTNGVTPTKGVFSLAVANGTVYLGGAFTSLGGRPRNRLAAVDAITGAVRDWNPDVDLIVYTLAVADDTVYAGGNFKHVHGLARTNLAAVSARTGEPVSWIAHANDRIAALHVAGDQVLVGGSFTRIANLFHRRMAAFDANSGNVSAWDPNVGDQVRAIASFDGRLYFGGYFSTVSGVARSRIAAFDLGSLALACWDPNVRQIVGGRELFPSVRSLSVASNTVYIGGLFNSVSGQPRNNLAALATDCPATVNEWNANADAAVNSVAFSRNTVFAGGVFQSVGGQYHPFFAVFAPEGAPRVTRQPRSQLVDVGGAVVLEAEVVGNAPLVYQWQHAGTNVPGATGASLSLAAAQVEQTGDYTLVVTNALGLVNSRPARITVIQPVAIAADPVSQTVAPGTTVVLSVVASGNPPPVYQWRLNGVNIPGAIHPSLVLSNAQAADGGSYNVVVAGIREAISSAVATLVVSSPALPFADHQADRGTISGASGVGSGSNLGATREPGESNHAGKVGGASVWLRWVAPASGIAAFSTRGSSFDTLLGIYTNAVVGGIGRVTSDEDRGGFLTSRAAFNALGGAEYLIAVDGFAGFTGEVVLTWDLDTNTVEFPRLLNEPVSQTVFGGQDATFEVDVSSLTPVTYQWFFGCQPISAATNATLTIPNVRPEDVGEYRVVVMNDSSQVAESVPAVLEIGPETKVVSRDKPEDILFPPDLGIALAGSFAVASASDGFLSVSLGSIDAQTLNNKGATHSLDEPNHCGVLGGASRWLGLRAAGEGTLIIDTIGSTIDTVLAVYRETNNAAYLFSSLVDCNNNDNGASDGSSLVRFQTRAGQGYLVAVDGVNKAEGTIRINWKLGPPATLTPPIGGTVTLRATATNGVPPPVHQWYFNQQRIAGATNVTLVLANLQASESGAYSVISSNIAGTFTQTHHVTVGVLYSLSVAGTAANGFGFWVSGNTGRPLVVQAATNLSYPGPTIWTPLLTNPMLHSPVYILDSSAPRYRQRYYRTVVP